MADYPHFVSATQRDGMGLFSPNSKFRSLDGSKTRFFFFNSRMVAVVWCSGSPSAAPSRVAQETSGSWGAFLLVTYSLGKQRKVTRRRGEKKPTKNHKRVGINTHTKTRLNGEKKPPAIPPPKQETKESPSLASNKKAHLSARLALR
jgi:hypothetical protein